MTDHAKELPHSPESVERALISMRELSQKCKGQGTHAIYLIEEQIRAYENREREPQSQDAQVLERVRELADQWRFPACDSPAFQDGCDYCADDLEATLKETQHD